MKIKICGILDVATVPTLCRLSPDMLGFIFYPLSPRYVIDRLHPPEISYLPGNISRVGVFVNPEPGFLQSNIENYGLDYIQLHGNESPGFCHWASGLGVKIIKAFSIAEDFDFAALENYSTCSEYFLFDTATKNYGGSGIPFDWRILEKYKLDHPFLLSGGINPGHVNAILSLRHPQFAGIDLNSGFEVRPGTKDVGRIEVFLGLLREERGW